MPSRPTVAPVVPVPGAGRVVVGVGLDVAGPGPPCAGEDPHDASASASAVARAAASAAGRRRRSPRPRRTRARRWPRLRTAAEATGERWYGDGGVRERRGRRPAPRPRRGPLMPVWLSEDEYRVLGAACERLIPEDDTAGRAARRGARTTSTACSGPSASTRRGIWAGGPTSGRHGGDGAFHLVPPAGAARRAGVADAHRGLAAASPSGSSTGPSSGSKSGTGPGWRPSAPTSATSGGDEQDERLRAGAAFTALLYGHCCEGMYGAPEYGGNRDAIGVGGHRVPRRRPAPGLQRRRGGRPVTDRRRDRRIGTRGRDGGRRPHRGRAGAWSSWRRGATTSSTPTDPTRLAGDYSNDEIKFLFRHFLGPDPFVEPRTFRTGPEDGDRRYVGEVNSIPSTVGGGGHPRRRQGAALSRGGLRPAHHARPDRRRRRRGLAARLRRARAVLRRGRTLGRRGRRGGGEPLRRLALGPLPDAARGADVRRHALVGGRRAPRPASLRRAHGRQLRPLRRAAGLQQLRVLRVLRLPHPRQGRPGGHAAAGVGLGPRRARVGDLRLAGAHRRRGGRPASTSWAPTAPSARSAPGTW